MRNLLKANLDKLARVSMDKTHLRVGAARHDEWLIEGQLKKRVKEINKNYWKPIKKCLFQDGKPCLQKNYMVAEKDFSQIQ